MKKQKLGKEEIGAFCLALRHLIHAGIDPADALALMAEDETDALWRERLAAMARQADDGMALDDILKEAGCFPDYMCSLMEIGARTGRTEESLGALAQYYENRARMERRLWSALLYPAVLCGVLVVVVVILLVWVLPVFNEAYIQLGSSLTGFAGMLLSLGNGLRRALPALCILLGAAAACAVVLACAPGLRDRAAGLVQKRWGDRGIRRQVNEARFAQALSMCLLAGLSPQEAIDLSDSMGQQAPGFQSRCRRCLDQMEQGAALPAALGEQQLLSRADCRLLEAGFRSGSGEAVMERIAERLLEDSEAALEHKAARIEPALVIVLSVLVGGILLSVMLPLMNIMSAIG